MHRLVPLSALLLTACIPHPRGDWRDPDAAAPPPPPPPVTRDMTPPRDEAPEPFEEPPIRTVALGAGGKAAIPPQVARAKPAWTAAPVVPDAIDVPASTHMVKPGETLRGVASATGAGSEAIARENALDPPFMIRAGQRLRIPAGRYHRVRAGQSGIAIARAYGVDWARVVAINQLAEPYVLRVDMRLLIPGRQEVRAMTLEERAAAFKLDVDDLITGSEPALAKNAEPIAPVTTAKKAVSATEAVAEPSRFAGRFAWPLTGPILVKFGPYGSGRINEGIDIGTEEGTPVYAAADGVVAYVGNEIAVYGGLILIKHGEGWITTYGHASELLVTRGQAVKKGQLIARAGMTGSAREPKLHFEIRQGRKPVNPVKYLPRA